MRRRFLLLLSALTPFLLLPGCGGGSTPPPPPPVTISISGTATALPVNATAFFFAAITGSSNHAVTWQVNGTTGGDSTFGTINTAGTYSAPAVIPSPATVTIKAIAQADTTKTDSASLTVTLAVSPSSATLLIQGGTQQFIASGTASAINWTVTCFLPCDPSTIGTVSSTGLYTAPDAIPDNVLTNDYSVSDPFADLGFIASPITVTAALQSDPSTAGSASVFVNAGGPLVNHAFQSAPVKLGTSGGNVQDKTPGVACCSGTLGSLVVRNGTNYILSNNHVLARSGSASNGEAIGQPGLVDNNCSPGMTVANLSQQVTLNHGGTSAADAAIAAIMSGQVDTTGTSLQLGTVAAGLAQPAPPASTTGIPTVGMLVAKNGRTTGLSCSTILATGVDGVTVTYENSCGSNSTFNVTYNNQVVIESESFGGPGDSGSLIVDAQTAEPVALLYAGSPTDTIANPIQDVLAALPDSASPPHFPTFVGGATHEVAACTGFIGPSAKIQPLADAEIERAATAKKNHVAALLKDPAVIGVGVGAGDTPGEAAVIVFVDKEKSHRPIPASLDGVQTKVKSVAHFRAFDRSACPAERSVSATAVVFNEHRLKPDGYCH